MNAHQEKFQPLTILWLSCGLIASPSVQAQRGGFSGGHGLDIGLVGFSLLIFLFGFSVYKATDGNDDAAIGHILFMIVVMGVSGMLGTVIPYLAYQSFLIYKAWKVMKGGLR